MMNDTNTNLNLNLNLNLNPYTDPDDIFEMLKHTEINEDFFEPSNQFKTLTIDNEKNKCIKIRFGCVLGRCFIIGNHIKIIPNGSITVILETNSNGISIKQNLTEPFEIFQKRIDNNKIELVFGNQHFFNDFLSGGIVAIEGLCSIKQEKINFMENNDVILNA